MAFLDEILDKVENAGADGSVPERSYRSRAAIACMIAGALTGLMVGYSKKWNLFYSAAGGLAIGGVAGMVFTPAK